MENMGEKWYNSVLARGVSLSVIFLSLAFGIGPCTKGCVNNIRYSENELEMERIKKGYTLQEADIIGNSTPDKFYIINGNIAIVEIDGNRLNNKLDK